MQTYASLKCICRGAYMPTQQTQNICINYNVGRTSLGMYTRVSSVKSHEVFIHL